MSTEFQSGQVSIKLGYSQNKQELMNLHITQHQPQEIKTKINNDVQINTTEQNNQQQQLQFFQNYEPMSPNLNIRLLRKSISTKIKMYKDCTFYGEFMNGKRHGQGIMKYKNGRIYEGQWQNDSKFGRGYEKFLNQTYYCGQYLNGKPHGIGTFCWPNGQCYEGQWVNGLRDGYGMWKGAKGDTYTGNWKFGKANGEGIHVWINGDQYEGEFKQSVKHGYGIQKFINGDIFKGQYAFGKPQGYGQYYWKNRSYFKGMFSQGRRQGHGVWKGYNNDKYEGQYLHDKKNGFGIFSWASGSIYKGYYVDDIRNGQGQMYWSDGSYYKGEWKNGQEHGSGQLYTPSEGLQKGIFQHNKIVYIEQKQQKKQEGELQRIGTVKTTSFISNSLKLKNSYQPHQEKPIKHKQKVLNYQTNNHDNNYTNKNNTIEHFRKRFLGKKPKNTSILNKSLSKQKTINPPNFYLHRFSTSINERKVPKSEIKFTESMGNNLMGIKFRQIKKNKRQRYSFHTKD